MISLLKNTALLKPCYAILLAACIPFLTACDFLGVNEEKQIRYEPIKDPDLEECIAKQSYGFRAEEVRDIVCAAKTIEKLDGLEQFVNLRTLILNTNRIRKVDLSSFKGLQLLDLSANRLTEVDLSNNPELLEVYLDNNSLDNLDVRKNKKLEALVLTRNQISELDLSKNVLLEELVMDQNALVGDLTLGALDLSNNVNLINLNLYDNEITKINLWKNRNLDKLDLRQNQIKRINLKNNKNLTDLRISDNELTSLDLRRVTNLDTVLAEDNFIEEISLPLTKKLRFAYLRGNLISCDNSDCNGLNRFRIPDNETFIHLDLSDNLLSTDDIDLNDNLNFSELFLSGNAGMTGVFDMSVGEKLVELRLDDTNITSINFGGYTTFKNVFDAYDIKVLSAVNAPLDQNTKDLLDSMQANRKKHPRYPNVSEMSYKY